MDKMQAALTPGALTACPIVWWMWTISDIRVEAIL